MTEPRLHEAVDRPDGLELRRTWRGSSTAPTARAARSRWPLRSPSRRPAGNTPAHSPPLGRGRARRPGRGRPCCPV